MTPTMRRLTAAALATLAMATAGCDDPCKSEDAALEVAVVLGAGVDAAAVASAEARVLAVGLDRIYPLTFQARRAGFRVEIGAVGEDNFTAQVRIRALDKNQGVVAEATAALENAADGCNQHEVTLKPRAAVDAGTPDAAQPDAGADATQPD